jgi:membrane protease YdiL (CAAX protease family)
MILLAIPLRQQMHVELLLLVKLASLLYVLLSFIGVATYTAKKVHAGRLINGRSAPLAFSIPPAGKWLLVFNVFALLFVQSAVYLGAVVIGILLLIAANRRASSDSVILFPAAAWLFALNVIVLLLMQSPYYMIVVVTGLMILLVESRRTAQEQFGLDRLSVWQVAKWSLLTCGAVILVLAPLTELIKVGLDALHLSHPDQQSVEKFRQYTDPSDIMDFMIQAVLIAPIIEELFFRGFPLTFLKKYTSTWVALVLSAGVFAFAHVNLGSVLPLWFLGIVLGVAYEHTGSILLPMGIHACFNLTTALGLLIDKGSS